MGRAVDNAAPGVEPPGNKAEYQLALRLQVDTIRSLRPEPDSPAVPGLDVQWDRLTVRDETGALTPDTRPGAAGHAGITGLARGAGVTRLHTKSLRSQLADAAIAFLVEPDALPKPPST
jgi:hypothetical protein